VVSPPAFDYEVLEEDDRRITARHGNGIVTVALKEGAVRGTRMSMDSYISHPVKDRESWLDVKRRAGIRSFWVDSDGDSEALIPLWVEAGINCFRPPVDRYWPRLPIFRWAVSGKSLFRRCHSAIAA